MASYTTPVTSHTSGGARSSIDFMVESVDGERSALEGMRKRRERVSTAVAEHEDYTYAHESARAENICTHVQTHVRDV